MPQFSDDSTGFSFRGHQGSQKEGRKEELPAIIVAVEKGDFSGVLAALEAGESIQTTDGPVSASARAHLFPLDWARIAVGAGLVRLLVPVRAALEPAEQAARAEPEWRLVCMDCTGVGLLEPPCVCPAWARHARRPEAACWMS